MEALKHEEYMQQYEAAIHDKLILLPRKWNVEDEMDAIKRQVELDCIDPNSPNFVSAKTDIPKQVKRVLAEHQRYRAAEIELRQIDIELIRAEASAEVAKMRANALVAFAENRQLKPDEVHTHPIG